VVSRRFVSTVLDMEHKAQLEVAEALLFFIRYGKRVARTWPIQCRTDHMV
jgi:hypothetical protein